MFAPESYFENRKLLMTPCSLSDLPSDLKRVLSVQFREFIHTLEDAQTDNFPDGDLQLISLFERCLLVSR